MATTNRNKSAPACPNPASSPHNNTKATNRRLSRAQVRTVLATIDMGPGSDLRRYANYRGWMAGIDADDLLQEALLRALSSRSCSRSITIEVFLKGIMRSIASATIERREREIDIEISNADAVTSSSSGIAQPDDILEWEERKLACSAALVNVCRGSPHAESVLDGIDQGLRGRDLAYHARIGVAELATVRRFLKRRAVAIWNELDNDESIAA